MAASSLGSFGDGTDCPRCAAKNALKAEANPSGYIGVVILCTHCHKEWVGGWGSVERTRVAMTKPGYIENELTKELDVLIYTSKNAVWGEILDTMNTSLTSRIEHLHREGPALTFKEYDKLESQISLLKDMVNWAESRQKDELKNLNETDE